jgi:hypothetical protein
MMRIARIGFGPVPRSSGIDDGLAARAASLAAGGVEGTTAGVAAASGPASGASAGAEAAAPRAGEGAGISLGVVGRAGARATLGSGSPPVGVAAALGGCTLGRTRAGDGDSS